MGSKWRKAKLALGLNLCVYVPRTLDDSAAPSSERLSDAALLSPTNWDSRPMTPTPSSHGLRLAKSGSKPSKVCLLYIYFHTYMFLFGKDWTLLCLFFFLDGFGLFFVEALMKKFCLQFLLYSGLCASWLVHSLDVCFCYALLWLMLLPELVIFK
jgi:hypothetical protein